MVQARRAKVRPARVIVPLVIAAALLVGGSAAAVKFWPDATTAGPQPESSATTEAQSPTTAESSPSPSVSASSSKPVNAPAAQALQACQEKVKAADAVLKQGKTGVEHWAEHVDAQKDYFAGDVSATKMKGRFKKTRLKGPADLKRYNDAVSTYEDLDGSCAKVEGAEDAVAATLAKCDARSKAQQPVLKATAAGMKDWKNHQTFMARNALHKEGTPAQAQASWLKQYRAAPKNINAFKKADENFDAPSC